MARRRLAAALLTAAATFPAAAQAAWPGANGAVVWSSGGDLVVDGQNITNTPQDEAQASWSPDGTRLAFRTRASTAEPFHLAIVRADGSGRVDLPGSAFNETQPGWSPDGARLVYRRSTRGEDLSGDVWSMAADGSDRRPLVTSPDDERYPALSPQGTQLVFTRNVGVVDIFVANADGTDQRPLVAGPERESAPSWAPQGDAIAFERGPGENSPGNEVWTRSTCTGQERRLTADATLDEGPAWSPDGGFLAFTSARDGTLDIFRMRADGSEVVRIAGADGPQESPDWQPAPPASPRAGGPCGPGGATPAPLPPPPTPPTDPDTPDVDRDGLMLAEESAQGSSDRDRDSDDDGLSDFREVRRTRTSPRRFDTDRDRISDGVELGVRRPVADPPGDVRGTSRRRFRRDRDPRTRTNPRRRDTDRDGVADGREDRDRDGRRDRGERDPRRRG